jgi:hypothetical protein
MSNHFSAANLRSPGDMPGAGPEIGVWATTSVSREGTLGQVDRGGKPTIDQLINPGDARLAR